MPDGCLILGGGGAQSSSATVATSAFGPPSLLFSGCRDLFAPGKALGSCS